MEPGAPQTPTEEFGSASFAASSADLHLIVDRGGVVRFASAAGRRVFGWGEGQLLGEAATSLAHGDDVGLVAATHRRALEVPGATQTCVYRFRCGDGSSRWVESVSRASEVAGTSVVSTVRDIGDRRNADLELQRRATTDPLTGVANREVFMDRLQHALLRLDRSSNLVAVLFLDLDRFKVINDSTGHHVGDAVLAQMAERLLGFLRPEDTLARLGGDEFAIVLEDIGHEDDAVALGERIVASGSRPFVVRGEEFICTTSVGIAFTADAQQSPTGLLQEADLAMYRAKDRGRDRAELFDEDLRTRAVGRLGTERMLRRAIDEERLRVEYQPIVALPSRAVVAAEVLVRIWDPEDERMIAAAEFIEVAEVTGLLPAVDDWVLDRALDQAALWHRDLGGAAFADVSINLTARHLADPQLAPDLIEALVWRGVPPSVLQIEVTEHVLMEASNSTMDALRSLRSAGVRVGLDDFGTGYSSLTYLRQFPVDFVKIDRSFVSDLVHGKTERAIVGAVVSLAHALGMSVVAEGVETEAQYEVLCDLGCDRGQGHLFAPSGSAASLELHFAGPSSPLPGAGTS